MLTLATALNLPFWQDPQSPLAVAVFEASCHVFFRLWDDTGHEIPAHLGKITFSRCWSTRTLNMDLLPYSVLEHSFHSFILEVPDSSWLAALSQTRLTIYPKWKEWDAAIYHHYVVEGDNSFLEVLAEGFTTSLASPEECQYHAFLLE